MVFQPDSFGKVCAPLKDASKNLWGQIQPATGTGSKKDSYYKRINDVPGGLS
jgi:hypothetical protein